MLAHPWAAGPVVLKEGKWGVEQGATGKKTEKSKRPYHTAPACPLPVSLATRGPPTQLQGWEQLRGLTPWATLALCLAPG